MEGPWTTPWTTHLESMARAVEMVEQCIKVAEGLAALGGDADAASRVRTLTADLVRRYVESAAVAWDRA